MAEEAAGDLPEARGGAAAEEKEPDLKTPRRSTRKRKQSIEFEAAEEVVKKKTPSRATKKSRPEMPNTTRSPGTGKGAQKGGRGPDPDATPTENRILRELGEMKGMMGGMETRLGDRVTDLEKKLGESTDTTLAAVSTLEERVKKNELDLEPKINRALDAKIQGGAIEAAIEKVVDRKIGEGAAIRGGGSEKEDRYHCLLYTSPSPRD